MNFLKKEPIDDLNDISYVNPEIEYKSTISLTLEIFNDSIFNIFPILLLVIIEGMNLLFVGHIKDDSNVFSRYQLFNFLQIGITFLNLFGFTFAIGTLKTAKKCSNLQNYFHITKIMLMGIVVIIILPFTIFSYLIMSFLYENECPETLNMLWYLYTNFLIYTPLYIFFQLLLQLNFRLLQIFNAKTYCLWIFIFYVSFHALLLYVFVFYFNLDIKGILLSLTLSSFIFYVYTNSLINENDSIIKNFYFIPDFSFTSGDGLYTEISKKENNNEFYKILKDNMISGLIYYAEYCGMGFFTLFSIFIDSTSLTAHIILMNFFLLLHTMGYGFSYTLRHYIELSMSSYKHSHIGKKKFVKVLSILAFCIALSLAIIILIVDGSIINMYLATDNPNSSNENNLTFDEIKNLFGRIANLYAIIIFFDYTSKVLDGYVKGIDAKTTHLLIYKILFNVVFLPAGLVLCFMYDYGLMGFWIAIYSYIFIYAIINTIYVYKYYARWIR